MKKRVLVIDDQKLICDVTERWLSNNGYEVLRAYDGKTGYNIIDNEKPDLVLIDILLPGISGIELCEKVRQVDKLKHIPLVLMSAVYKDRALLNQINSIADDFIEKPFKENELITKVKQFLQSPASSLSQEKKNDELEVEYVEDSINKITYDDDVTAGPASSKPPPSALPEEEEPVSEKKQTSPDKTVQLDLNEDLDFEYTDPGLMEEEPAAAPPPGATQDDEVVMLNLAPIKKESDKEPDKPVKEEKDDAAKKKGNTDRFVEQELENLFKIVKDK